MTLTLSNECEKVNNDKFSIFWDLLKGSPSNGSETWSEEEKRNRQVDTKHGVQHISKMRFAIQIGRNLFDKELM